MPSKRFSRKKSFCFVEDLANDIESVSVEIGLSETALVVLSVRAYIAAYKAEKAKATKLESVA